MINYKHNLTVLHDNNSSFIDYTNEAASYLRDSIALSLVANEDYIYIGYEKPINSIYIDLETAASANTFTGEFYNGTTFTSINNLYDDSQGCSRDGFINWSRNQLNETKTTVNSLEMYWYRFKPSIDITLTLTGLNTVFNDLQDLLTEYSEVADDADTTPGVDAFVNAKNNILQRLNQSNIKQDAVTGQNSHIDQWDMLEIDEVRMAATYFCMAKFWFHQNDAPDDVYITRYSYYNNLYEKYLDDIRISLDTNDNGLKDSSETAKVSSTRKFYR